MRPHSLGLMRGNNRRHGIALVETVAIIGIIGTVLSLSAVLLNRAFNTHKDALQAFRRIDQLNFWNERLRSDAHQAIEATVAEGLTLVRQDDRQVLYFAHENRLVRTVKFAEQIESRETLDGHMLHGVRWSIDEQGKGLLLSAEIEFGAEPEIETIRWYARINAFHRQVGIENAP